MSDPLTDDPDARTVNDSDGVVMLGRHAVDEVTTVLILQNPAIDSLARVGGDEDNGCIVVDISRWRASTRSPA
jgi:hypothetical protein